MTGKNTIKKQKESSRIKIETVNSRDKIYLFLKHVEYRKFNLWPNVTGKNLVEFLFKKINEAQTDGKIFIATKFNKITALLVIKTLDWDTQHFGFKCAKIEYILTSKVLCDNIVEESLERILDAFQKYCIESNIKFVNVVVDSRDYIISMALQKVNFRYISTYISGIFETSTALPEIKSEAKVGIIRTDEVDYFKKISPLYYFKNGRFYLDARFDRQQVDKMYEALIESSFKNNYIMLVYRLKDKPVGLFICKEVVTYESFSNLRVAPLSFLIVDPEFRSRKVAYNLFLKTLEYLKDKSDLIETGLDVHNLQSLNLHSKLGFRFNYTQNVYHWWNNSRG